MSTPNTISFHTDATVYHTFNLSIFPVEMRGSTPVPPKDWTKYGLNVPNEKTRTEWSIKYWSSLSQDVAVALPCGKVYNPTDRIVCLDIDDDRLVKALSFLYPSPCARFGSKGLGIFYRVAKDDDEMKKSQNFMLDGKPAVEYLSTNRFTFIPPSHHRKTGKPYEWVGKPLLEAIGELPLLTPKDLRVIRTIISLDADGATINNILDGESTHHAALALVARLVGHGLAAERVQSAIEYLFPHNYSGDTLKQLPDMVRTAFEKGYDKQSDPSKDGEDVDLKELFAGWHYVVSLDRFANPDTREILDSQRFNAVFGKQLKRAATVYAQWQDNSIIPALTYLPGRPQVVNGLLNWWKASPIVPKPGDVSLWLNHIGSFYETSEVEHLLNWLAHTLQRPSIKPGHAVLMGSQHEGIGKDLWLLPIRSAFGDLNVSEIGADALSSQFNEWLAHKHLVIVQEVWTGARRELSNALKPLLSSPPETIMVNEKGIARYPVPNICASIMLTNHKDAISMAAEDRRYFVIWSEVPPKSPEYYTDLADWVSNPDHWGHVLHYLLTRDISKFNIKAPPPKTSAKAEMVDATMTKAENLVQVVHDLFAGNIEPVVSESMLYERLKNIAPDIAKDVMRVPRFSSRYPIRLALKKMHFAPVVKKAAKKIAGRVHFVQVYVHESELPKYEEMRPVDLYDLVSTNLPTDY